jgi:hypothetical protein
MRLVVIIVAALTIVGVAALGLILAQKGNTRTATAASTVYIASVTQEVSALPTRAPVSQIAQATGSEAPPLILQANVDAQSGSPMTTFPQAPSAAAVAPNVKDQSASTISKAVVHDTTRLKDDATGWAHKLQELELDLKLQLDLKKNQDVEATSKNINECLVVLRAAAGRLAPDAETRVTLRKQEVAVRDLAIRAEVHPDPEIRKTAGYFQQKTTELHALNRSVEEIRTRLITQIDRLEERLLECAEAQEPSAAKAKADAQKFVKMIIGDKAKSQIYCDVVKLGEQIEETDSGDKKKADELYQQVDELTTKLGPEYIALMNELQDMDPDSEDGKEIGSTLESLEKLCSK